MQDKTGLTNREAAELLQMYGYNELPIEKGGRLSRIVFEVLREPVVTLLLATGIIYLALGERQDAMMLLGFFFVIVGITIYQSVKAERAMEALRDLSSPRALVIRDGNAVRISGREVVRGDLAVIREGDRIPADGVVVESTNLSVDESPLTGESVPVSKFPSASNESIVYGFTLVVRGSGVIQIQATGSSTKMGQIGRSLQLADSGITPLQSETRRLVGVLAIFAGGLCVLVGVLYYLSQRDLLGGLLVGLTLAMAILPNELPAVLVIFLSLGAWRLSRSNVLTRKTAAVESLGAATVLCVDKTGTLTENRMSVREIWLPHTHTSVSGALSDEEHEIIEYAILASPKDPFDPMDKAFRDLGTHGLSGTEHLHPEWSIKQDYPLSKWLMAVTYVWSDKQNEGFAIAAKGAPEAIIDLCHLPEDEKARWSERAAMMADEGLRVLGVAKGVFRGGVLPKGQHDFDYQFLGLTGLQDPVRASTGPAISECRKAGIRVVMLTGDHARTARSIARQIGIDNCEQVITGPEMERMNGVDLRREVERVNVFARILPEQKLKLVNLLKAKNQVVAMTGDGVNDAPALKTANIGIAMGERGSDVARETAAIVLLKDEFSSIVEAIRTGRRISDNLKKALAYLLSVHVPIVGMSIIPAAFGLPLVLLPAHIAFLHLIIEPACSVAFEAEAPEKNVMNRPPNRMTERLFSKRLVIPSLIQGFVVFTIVLLVFLISLFRGQTAEDARALTFTTLVIANVGLIVINQSWRRSFGENLRLSNITTKRVIGGALVTLVVTLYVPFFRDLFRFSVLHTIDIVICFAAGMASVYWFQIAKKSRISRRFVESV